MIELAKSLSLSLADPFVRSLACAAITPGLQSILLFDSSLEVLQLSAQIISQMLEVVIGYPVKTNHISTFEGEDNLWGSWQLEQQILQWRSGLLADDSQVFLVIIPDLSKLSLAAARACVVLMGADVAHLERHGKQNQWRPNICWLAGCTISELGMVSPHLLDRFALRLKGEVRNTTDKTKQLLSLLGEQELEVASLPAEIENKLKDSLRYSPQITTEAIARILQYFPKAEIYPRREIALARLSLANARLDGADVMGRNHVDKAAGMMKLEIVNQSPIPEPPNPVPQPPPIEPPKKEPPKSTPKSTLTPEKRVEPVDVHKSDESEPLPSLIYTLDNPYPEDQAAVEREVDSLRLPTKRFQSKAASRGVMIGVEKARNFQDLAIVATLLEAAKYQPIRRKNSTANTEKLLLSPTDFYAYRRSPVAEQMLTLVIDYTCLQACNWQEKLLPYLSWAYVERANVCLIQVGAANASNDLQAERIMAQSVLVPRINQGLEAKRGKATPLAHGLDLALQTLRHALQHGRSTIQQAIVVVISDGRGNVPLEDSRIGKISSSVGAKGVDDSLLVAESIHNLDRVKVVVLNPQPKQYKDFPLKLAEKMGALIDDIPPLEIVEEE